MIRVIRAGGAAQLAAALLASPAAAAKPFTLDGRTQTNLVKTPAVAVDAQGTAHVVWAERRRCLRGDLVEAIADGIEGLEAGGVYEIGLAPAYGVGSSPTPS